MNAIDLMDSEERISKDSAVDLSSSTSKEFNNFRIVMKVLNNYVT